MRLPNPNLSTLAHRSLSRLALPALVGLSFFSAAPAAQAQVETPQSPAGAATAAGYRVVDSAPVAISLRWQSPDEGECIDVYRLRAATNELLSRTALVSEGEAELRVVGQVEADNTGRRRRWRATLRLESLDQELIGTRTIVSNSPRCSALDDELAIVLALVVDLPRRQVSLYLPPPPEEVIDDLMDEAVERLGPGEPPRIEDDAERAPLSLALGMHALGTVEMLPGPSIGLGGWMALGVQPWLRVEFSGSFFFPQRNGAPTGGTFPPGSGSQVWLWELGLKGCPGWELSSFFALDGCVGAYVGQLSAEGFGFDRVEYQEGLWAHLDVRVRARLLLGPMEVGLAVGPSFPVLIQSFTVEAPEEVLQLFEAPPVFGQAELTLGMSWDGS